MNTLNNAFTENNMNRVRNIYLYVSTNEDLKNSLADFRKTLLNAGYQEDEIFLLVYSGKILSQEIK